MEGVLAGGVQQGPPGVQRQRAQCGGRVGFGWVSGNAGVRGRVGPAAGLAEEVLGVVEEIRGEGGAGGVSKHDPCILCVSRIAPGRPPNYAGQGFRQCNFCKL